LALITNRLLPAIAGTTGKRIGYRLNQPPHRQIEDERQTSIATPMPSVLRQKIDNPLM
jgi:hypothetical protein